MWSGKFPGLGEQTFLPNMWLEQASAITVLWTQEINAPNMPLLLKGKDSKRKEDVRKINIKPPKKTPLIQLQAVLWDRDWSAASRIHQVAPEVELRHISTNGECAWECNCQLHCPVSVPVLCWSRWNHNWAMAWWQSLTALVLIDSIGHLRWPKVAHLWQPASQCESQCYLDNPVCSFAQSRGTLCRQAIHYNQRFLCGKTLLQLDPN